MSVGTIHSSASKPQLSNPEIRSFARSLGLGALGGLLCAYVLYLHFPQLLADGIPLKHTLLLGSALGFYLYRLISKLIGQTLRPLYGCAAYYSLIMQLEFQQRHGLISKDDYQTIKRRLDYAYFLGEHGNQDGSAIRVDAAQDSVERNSEGQRKVRRPRAVASIKTPSSANAVTDLQF